MIGTKLKQRYEIHTHLGDGSTATVYQAFDNKLGREVALKVLLPHVRRSTARRFFQEAKAAALLNHPNIMSIYDIDEDDGWHFLVVEYVEGNDLTHYIPSPADVVVKIGIQITSALQYAHDHDIIHRDIKPANIKVTPTGQVKIMDLGLARPSSAKRVTTPGIVMGTPAYISPEQAQGHTLDSRTDMYSLGVVLYEMITGELPFHADDITALLIQHVQEQPTPPSQVIDDIPTHLEATILKLLKKKPDNRYTSMDAVAQALQTPTYTPQPSHETPTTQAPTHIRRIVLADDHTILRKTLANFIESNPAYRIVGEASDGNEALEQIAETQPDLLILDLNMPNKSGLQVLPEIKQSQSNVKVLVLTGRDDDAYIVQALRSGANGYMLKSATENDLLDAIDKVIKGELVLGRGIAEKVVTGLLGMNSDGNALSTIERQVLLYVAAGYTNATIGRQLAMSMTDVIEHLAQIMNKLQANDRHAAALKALRMGEISIEGLHDLIEDVAINPDA